METDVRYVDDEFDKRERVLVILRDGGPDDWTYVIEVRHALAVRDALSKQADVLRGKLVEWKDRKRQELKARIADIEAELEALK